jgi:hypothetical protein
MVNRSKIALKVLPYIAGVIFLGMWIAAMDVSSELSMMTDTGFNLYHDQIDVQVFWLQSKACMVLPPDGYLANCVNVTSISAIPALTALLIVALSVYAILRRREGLAKANPTRSQSPL